MDNILLFPMAYCNGELHIGHLHVLTQIYAVSKVKNNTKIIFPYHTSGLPAVLFFENYMNKLKSSLELVKKFNKGEVKTLTKIDEWFNLVRQYNNNLLIKLKYEILFDHSHFTGQLEYNYNQMVLYIYDYLHQLGLIYEGIYPTLYCANCNHAVGDHDLKEDTKFYEVESLVKMDSKFLYMSEGLIYYSKKLNKYIKCNLDTYNSLKYIYDLEIVEIQFTIPQTDSLFKYQKLQKSVECRCGNYIGIKNCHQYFIDYSNAEWKQLCLKRLTTLVIQKEVFNEIKQRVKDLKGWPLLRSRGLGTKYKNGYIDSLSDSVLFPIYSLIHPLLKNIKTDKKFWKNILLLKIHETDLEKNIIDLLNNCNFIEITGKDLVPNHITFSIFFNALFQIGLKEIFVTGHILANNKKMSKSLNNIVTVEELSNYSAEFVKYLLLTCAQGLEDGNLLKENIPSKYREFLTLCNLLDQEGDNTTFTNYLDYILRKDSKKYFKNIKDYKFKTFYQNLNTMLYVNSYWFKNVKKSNLTKRILKNLFYLLISNVQFKIEEEIVCENFEYWQTFDDYLNKLDKDLTKWFSNKHNLNCKIILPKNHTISKLLEHILFKTYFITKYPNILFSYSENVIDTPLFKQI
jgi:leucyl-tRNA synthetase